MTAGASWRVRRPPAVAGAFYPADAARLRAMVDLQVRDSERRYPAPARRGEPLGILVPHAGLEFSGTVAAAAWRTLAHDARALTVVLLGTNHRAGWLDGVGIWDRGVWSSPLGEVAIDEQLAAAVAALGPPFVVDLEAHLEEHSLEVQLPILQVVAPAARIVPLAVSAGIGAAAIEAGSRLGRLIAERRTTGDRIVLAISTDMAHYPAARDAALVTSALEDPMLRVNPAGLAAAERGARAVGVPGLVCGMCGIEPAVTGLAALAALGAARGVALAAATSADAGGPRSRAVGYLAARFDEP